jgi:flagellar capping protein FliD
MLATANPVSNYLEAQTMAVSGISAQNSSLLTQLYGQQGTSSDSETSVYAPSVASAKQSSDEAYQLSLGKQKANQGVLGYGQLGKLVRQADKSITEEAQKDLQPLSVIDGNGNFAAKTYSVFVQQLAQGQKLASAHYGDPSTTSLGTGALTVTAKDGENYDIKIVDGSLDGIAKSINGARVGITAKVLLNADGTYHLELTGPTGAENSFKLSGIDALTYDPSASANSKMSRTQEPKDALYTLDGGDVQRSMSNKIKAPDGVTIPVTALGTTKISVPFGFTQVAEAAGTLTDSLNGLLANIDDLTGEDGMLADNGDTAKELQKMVLATLGQDFSSVRSLSGLKDVGIATQADGMIAFDPAKLQEAYTANPEGVRNLLAHFAEAVHDALTGSQSGGAKAISQQVANFTGQLTQKLSLMDYLYPSDSSSSSSIFG